MQHEKLSLPLQPHMALQIQPADCTKSSLACAVVLGRNKTRKKSGLCCFVSGAWGDYYDLMEQAHCAVCEAVLHVLRVGKNDPLILKLGGAFFQK